MLSPSRPFLSLLSRPSYEATHPLKSAQHLRGLDLVFPSNLLRPVTSKQHVFHRFDILTKRAAGDIWTPLRTNFALVASEFEVNFHIKAFIFCHTFDCQIVSHTTGLSIGDLWFRSTTPRRRPSWMQWYADLTVTYPFLVWGHRRTSLLLEIGIIMLRMAATSSAWTTSLTSCPLQVFSWWLIQSATLPSSCGCLPKIGLTLKSSLIGTQGSRNCRIVLPSPRDHTPSFFSTSLPLSKLTHPHDARLPREACMNSLLGK